MDKKILLDKIIAYLISDRDIEIPSSISDKRGLWKELVSNLTNIQIPSDILETEDKFLRLELLNRKLTDASKLKNASITLDSLIKYKDKISLWEGDITAIYTDAIINPTNVLAIKEKMKKDRIDSLIFLRSGMRLRKKCMEIIKDNDLEIADVLVTRAYNIPCDYIIHVIEPVVDKEVTEENLIDLKMSYLNSLECAKNNMAKNIVIPIIGDGFELEEVIKIAVSSVLEFLDRNVNLVDKIIFQVNDLKEYNMFNKYLLGDVDA